MKLICNKSNPPLGGLIVVEYLKIVPKVDVEVMWGDEMYIEEGIGKVSCPTGNDVLRGVSRLTVVGKLYGEDALERTATDHWLTFATGPLSLNSDFVKSIVYLNKSLSPKTYLVGKRFTIADCAVFAALYASKQWQTMKRSKECPEHVLRWYNFIMSQDWVMSTLSSLPNDIKSALLGNKQSPERVSSSGDSIRPQEGKFVDLPGAEMGKVVVRFPPEASGYLHIGHAKAALLNQYYQQTFEGKFIMRFDDTNPAKENAEFEKVILEDVALLQIKPDLFTHTSEYFDIMLEYCEKLLKDGKAYVDDTEPEQMKQEREQRIESTNRNNTLLKNIGMWQEMVKGTEKGQKCCVRAKIDMQSANGCMRDPTIYRCKNESHPRTGDKYKVYPTYDFACPIVDAIEGVTHTLRTMEYHDRDPQFYWFINALGLRKPYIWEYSRLSMTNTVLSKRKLAWFVQENIVDGWDDPRFPTVRGVLRRGMTVEGLKQFIIAQGSSRSVVFMEWDKIWAFNKKVIDPIAPRCTAVDSNNPVVVHVKDVNLEKVSVAKHPKNADVGMKDIWLGPRILIDRVDADILKEGENTTFINWGNLKIKKINREGDEITSVDAECNLENKDYKKTFKLTWLAETDSAPFTPTYCVYFDHIISKPLLGKDEDFKKYIGHTTRVEYEMLGDPELRKLKKGDIIQLQRKGYFIVDVPYESADSVTCKEQPIILFNIPDGHTKESSLTPPLNKVSEHKSNSLVGKASVTSSLSDGKTLFKEIATQGDKVRDLKAAKVGKAIIDAEVKALLNLKAEYKKVMGKDWKPETVPSTPSKESACLLASLASTSTSTSSTSADVISLLEQITVQGDRVRELKTKKAKKSAVDSEVKTLLALKADFKTLTGREWTVGVVTSESSEGTIVSLTTPSIPSIDESTLSLQIKEQGDKVRDIKASKADKSTVDAEVKTLLKLKSDFKLLTRRDWKPENVVKVAEDSVVPLSAPSITTIKEISLYTKVKEQADKVRDLKSKKVEKSLIDVEVKTLLELKSEFKALTGVDWKPENTPNKNAENSVVPISSLSNTSINENTLLIKISDQGDRVRDLKSKKADKSVIDAEVKILLEQKAEYKALTGVDWKPENTPNKSSVNSVVPIGSLSSTSIYENTLLVKIKDQGDKVRDLKLKKANKSVIDTEVKTLLDLKSQYKTLTGVDWKAEGISNKNSANTVVPISSLSSTSIYENALQLKIKDQGDKVRDLKLKKANKSVIDTEIKALLDLKSQYKTLTGVDWKPEGISNKNSANTVVPISSLSSISIYENALLIKIRDQGDKLRDLKSKKANKSVIDIEVKTLLELKSEYKTLTGVDWKPENTPNKNSANTIVPISSLSSTSVNENALLIKVKDQSDKVRDLKSRKADKSVIDAEVKILLQLKSEYKTLTGVDWKPENIPNKSSVNSVVPISSFSGASMNENALLIKIKGQGDKIRELKARKSDKSVIDQEVQTLLELKAEFKTVSGTDWKPQMEPSGMLNTGTSYSSIVGSLNAKEEDALLDRIVTQADRVRDLKVNKADLCIIDAEVRILLTLKEEYKVLTGKEWKPGMVTSKSTSTKPPKTVKQANATTGTKVIIVEEGGGLKKQTRLGVEAKKEENLADWYSQVITKGEMIEYYDVSGCYILRPWSFAIWDTIKDWLDAEIKKLGVQNCYFPIFVSQSVLEKEKTHIADFAPEVAWVTKSGNSQMAEPVAIRPTSETVMYPAYAKWIQSFRDLPIKLNQWNNVVRWEFKHPQPFLRTREFLWQEGHTAYAQKAEAEEEVLTILNLYAKIYTDLLAIPVVKGRKTEKEKFAGGEYTYTVEAFISASGRAIQGATSHHLGQNFSKMFDIVYEDAEAQDKEYVYQNSWGITTRTIGVMIMIHADNQGLVLPPRVASIAIVIVPCGITAKLTDEDRNKLGKSCSELEEELRSAGLKVKGDYRNNYSPGWKFNHWELKGVPVRIELGPKDMHKSEFVAVRRDTGDKIFMKRETAVKDVKKLLDDIQHNLYAKASKDLISHTVIVTEWKDFAPNLDRKNIILAPFCGETRCEERIKADSARADDADPGAPSMGAKSLCIPIEQPAKLKDTDKCIHPVCERDPLFYTLFGRSY